MSGWMAVMNSDDRLRLGLAGRPATAVLRVARLPQGRPCVREVAVEVDEVGVGARARRLPVRVHRLDQPEVDAGREGRGRELLDDLHARRLVAVDHADDEHHGAARSTPLDGGDRPAVDRTPDLDHLEGVGRQSGDARERGRRRGDRRRRGGRRGRGGGGGRGDVVAGRRARGDRGARRRLVVVGVGAVVGGVSLASGVVAVQAADDRHGEDGGPSAHSPNVPAGWVRWRRLLARRCGCGPARRQW